MSNPDTRQPFPSPQGIETSICLDALQEWVGGLGQPTVDGLNAFLAQYRELNAGKTGIDFSLHHLMDEINSEIDRVETMRMLDTPEGRLIKNLQNLVAESLGPEV